MSNQTSVVWEKESDAKLARSLGGVPNSIMHTVKNDQEVMNTLDNSQAVVFKVESERLHVESVDGKELTKKSDFPNVPDATIIASKPQHNQVELVFEKETRERLETLQRRVPEPKPDNGRQR